MSSPGDAGPRGGGRDLRRDQDDASVTASLPSVAADTGPYPRSGMPGAASRDDWKGPSGVSGGAAGPAAPTGPTGSTAPTGSNGRTEVVPAVASAGGGAGSGGGLDRALGGGAAATSSDPRGAFAAAPGGLPPRPGEGSARAGAAGAAAGTAGTATATTGRRPLRDRAPRPARRAQLTLRRFNVWSVFKFSCMLAIALWLVWMIAIGVLYGILDAAGVVSSINDVFSQLQGDNADAIVRPGQVLGIAAIIGVVNIVLFIALSSVFAVIYNLVSDFVGGVEVTLSERE